MLLEEGIIELFQLLYCLFQDSILLPSFLSLFFEVYKMAGYTKQQVIQGVKSIDNWFDHSQRNKGIRATWENLAEKFSAMRNPRASPLLYDPKFIEICKDIGFDFI